MRSTRITGNENFELSPPYTGSTRYTSTTTYTERENYSPKPKFKSTPSHFLRLQLDNLKLKANFVNLYTTSRICCSSKVFNMCCATPAQPEIFSDISFYPTLIQPDIL